jgi:hypothetical protein
MKIKTDMADMAFMSEYKKKQLSAFGQKNRANARETQKSAAQQLYQKDASTSIVSKSNLLHFVIFLVPILSMRTLCSHL